MHLEKSHFLHKKKSLLPHTEAPAIKLVEIFSLGGGNSQNFHKRIVKSCYMCKIAARYGCQNFPTTGPRSSVSASSPVTIFEKYSLEGVACQISKNYHHSILTQLLC
jgi:hypothetical protein